MACEALACLTILVQPAACDETDAAKLLTDRYVQARASAMNTPVDLNSMCDEPGVYGTFRRNAKLYEMPWILLRNAQNRKLSPHIPVYCHPSVRFYTSATFLLFCCVECCDAVGRTDAILWLKTIRPCDV